MKEVTPNPRLSVRSFVLGRFWARFGCPQVSWRWTEALVNRPLGWSEGVTELGERFLERNGCSSPVSGSSYEAAWTSAEGLERRQAGMAAGEFEAKTPGVAHDERGQSK